MDNLVGLDVWGPKSLVKDMKSWTTYIDDYFPAVKVYVEQARLFE